jgi:hypothetical protein
MALLDEYYKPEQLAAELSIHVRTLRKLGERGEGPPVTAIGRLKLFRKSSVSEWLQGREQRKPRGRARQ